MHDCGIRFAVGDNSRKELRPLVPYHASLSIAKDSKNRHILVLPREATQLYFDASTAEENAKQHASMYGPHCYGYKQPGPVTFPFKCSAESFKYSRPLSIEELLEIESYQVARNLLAWRHDPYMFHQVYSNYILYFFFALDQGQQFNLTEI